MLEEKKKKEQTTQHFITISVCLCITRRISYRANHVLLILEIIIPNMWQQALKGKGEGSSGNADYKLESFNNLVIKELLDLRKNNQTVYVGSQGTPNNM